MLAVRTLSFTSIHNHTYLVHFPHLLLIQLIATANTVWSNTVSKCVRTKTSPLLLSMLAMPVRRSLTSQTPRCPFSNGATSCYQLPFAVVILAFTFYGALSKPRTEQERLMCIFYRDGTVFFFVRPSCPA